MEMGAFGWRSSPSEKNKQGLVHYTLVRALSLDPGTHISIKVCECDTIHKERDNWKATHFSMPCAYRGVGKHECAGWDLSPVREGRSSEEDTLGPLLGLKRTPEDLDLLRWGRGGHRDWQGR